MTLAELESLCVVLRAQGVRVYQAGDVRLELEPHGTPEPTKTEAQDPDVCRCGHPTYAHVNGLCTMGCDVELCAPPAEEKHRAD